MLFLIEYIAVGIVAIGQPFKAHEFHGANYT